MDSRKVERTAIVAAGLGEHLVYLTRLARSRVRDEHRVEEAVQDTLLAALESAHTFDGRAKLRTWLTGILLHKIHDGYRRAARDIATEPAATTEPVEWVTPDHTLHVKQLWGAFARALSDLPEHQADALLLREVSGLDTPQICRKLGISRANLWVLMHRARVGLRAALERDGFSVQLRRRERLEVN